MIPSLYPMPDHDTMVANILAVYSQASAPIREAGRDWYKAAHSYLAGLAEAYDTPLDVVCGVTAVLSPSQRWEINVMQTELLISGALGVTYAAYGNNVVKAWGVLAGDMSVVKGPKVSRFAALLNDPETSTVCVDTWAIRIALGRDDGPVKGYTQAGRIQKFMDAYGEAARLVGEQPSHIQAITWLCIRGE